MSRPRRSQRREAPGGLPLALVAVPAVVAAVAAAAVARRARGRGEAQHGARGRTETASSPLAGPSRPPPGLVQPLEQSLFEGWAPGSDPCAVWRALVGPDGAGLVSLFEGGGHQNVRSSVARVAPDAVGIDKAPEDALSAVLAAVRGAEGGAAAGGASGSPDVGSFAAPSSPPPDVSEVGCAIVLAYRTPISAGPFAPPFADNVQAVAVTASPRAKGPGGAAVPGLVAESLCSTAGVPFGAAVRPRVRWILWVERKRTGGEGGGGGGSAAVTSSSAPLSRVRISVSGACSLDPEARVPGILRGKIMTGARDGMRNSYVRAGAFVISRCGGGGELVGEQGAGGLGADEGAAGGAAGLRSPTRGLGASLSSFASAVSPTLSRLERRWSAALGVAAQRPEIAIAFALFVAVLFRIVLERRLERGSVAQELGGESPVA